MAIPILSKVKPLDDQQLFLCYDNGEKKIFDVKPYISGTWFGKLKDTDVFNTVHISPTDNTVEWSDGQDIAPHELYELSKSLSDDEI